MLKFQYPTDFKEGFANICMLIKYLQNFETMVSTIDINSVDKLPPIKGSALIIDKSMASTQFFEQLPALKDYQGTIICCDRALYALINNGIIPSYVVNVDVSPLCFDFFDHPIVKANMSKTKAVFPIVGNPLAVRLWAGERYFFTPMLGSLTKTLANESRTVIMATGGQVASTAYILACSLGAKEIGLFGITHSYDSMAESEYPLHKGAHTRVEGKYGVCWQDPVYEHYNNEYLELIEEAKKAGINTTNTSKSGLLYSEDVEDKSLAEFVQFDRTVRGLGGFK